METSELLEIVSRGKDRTHQFKGNFTNVNSFRECLYAGWSCHGHSCGDRSE